jgi:deazaflavin-dependent oxidoreductase (nitroreductase family)
MSEPSRLWRRVIPWISHPAGLAVDRWLVRATGHSLMGRAYLRAGGYPVRPHLLLTTLHWRTGARRTVVLPYSEDAGRYLVVGSHGGRPTDPIWALNVRAHPTVWVRPADRRWRLAKAHVAQGDERERLWRGITADGSYLYYAKHSQPRVIPIVVIEPVEPAAAHRPREDRAPAPGPPGGVVGPPREN